MYRAPPGILRPTSTELTRPGRLDPTIARQVEDLTMQLELGDLIAAGRTAVLLQREIVHVAARLQCDEQPQMALTVREREILCLLCDGAMSQKDVSRVLGISRNTTKSHLKSIYLKLGAHSRSEAVEMARRAGLLASSPVPLDETRAGHRRELTLVRDRDDSRLAV